MCWVENPPHSCGICKMAAYAHGIHFYQYTHKKIGLNKALVVKGSLFSPIINYSYAIIFTGINCKEELFNIKNVHISLLATRSLAFPLAPISGISASFPLKVSLPRIFFLSAHPSKHTPNSPSPPPASPAPPSHSIRLESS